MQFTHDNKWEVRSQSIKMSVEIGIFIFSLIDSIVLLFFAVFYIVNLSDLECDYINARTCCNRLNKMIVPEIVGHGLLAVSILSTFHLFPICWTLPMTIWIVYRALTMSKRNVEFFDPAEILNRNLLKIHTKEALVKLGYHLLSFFVFLYCLVIELQTKEVMGE